MNPANLKRLLYFTAVVETGSFTSAAERLGVTKSVISQQIARLEAELKTALLLRTTRRLKPTEAGLILYDRCSAFLREAESAFKTMLDANTEPRGLLRVGAPNDYGSSVIAPVVVEFSRRHPGCEVELDLKDARVDLIEDRYDVSIRVGWLLDSSDLARRIGAFRQVLVASPDLAGELRGDDLDDLRSWPFIANAALAKPFEWDFSHHDGTQRSVTLSSAIRINTTPAVLSAVLCGGGVSVLPDFLLSDHIREGRLVGLLSDWSLPDGGIYAVYPPSRFRPRKVAAFVEMLLQHIKSGVPKDRFGS